MTDKNYMLKSTHKILLEKVKILNKKLGGDIARELSQAYETGGQWHDNPHWDGMLQDQQQLIKKLQKILSVLKSAVFIEDLFLKGDVVTVGVKIEVEDEAHKKNIYKIVGSWDVEYNPLCKEKGFISYQSPLAYQLIGKFVGDEVSVILPAKNKTVVILAIELMTI